jgi:hypothetical protein
MSHDPQLWLATIEVVCGAICAVASGIVIWNWLVGRQPPDGNT